MIKLSINKILLVIIIISISILNCINAAIVSDNDGSAFVTKAEFESLKENFSNQIKNYNDSIDKKIDGAIASYLAGIKLEERIEQVSLLNKINENCNDAYVSGNTTIKYGYRCMAKSYSAPTTQKPEGAIVNFFLANALMGNTSGDFRGGGFARIGMDSGSSRTGLYDVNVPSSGRKTGKYIMLSKYNNKLYPVNNYNEIIYRYYATGSGAAHQYTGYPTVDPTINTVTWTFPTFKIEDNYWKLNVSPVNVHWDGGSGGLWDNINIFYGGSYEVIEDVNVIPNVGKVTGDALGLQNSNITKMRLQENTYNWTFYPYNYFYTWKQDGVDTSGNPIWVPSIAIANTQPDVSTTFYFNCHPYETVTLSDLIDYDATVAYGEGNVSIYGGLPIFKATSAGEVTMKIKFKSDLDHDVRIGLKKSQFANDETYTIDASLGLRNENDVKYTNNKFSNGTEYTFKMDVNRDDVIWIKTYDDSSDLGFTGAVTNGIVLVS